MNIKWNKWNKKQFQDAYASLPVKNVGMPSSIAFDPYSSNRFIYWIDSYDDKQIKRSSDLSVSKVCFLFVNFVIEAHNSYLFVIRKRIYKNFLFIIVTKGTKKLYILAIFNQKNILSLN